MNLFEYLAIAFGLFYSVGALRILGGLPSALEEKKRYWVHLGMSLLTLMAIASSFWAFWSLRDTAWTYPGFLLALLLPGLLFYCAAVLIPEIPEDVRSWHDHYFDVRRRLFIGYALWGVAAAASATVNLGMPLAHPARGVHVAAIVVATVGASSRKPRVHGAIVLTMVAMSLAWALTQGLRPDALAVP